MYTLRIFKNLEAIDRTQIYLGNIYTVTEANKKDTMSGIKLRVNGSSDVADNIAVHDNEHAFIMTSSGETFETLNRPKIEVKEVLECCDPSI